MTVCVGANLHYDMARIETYEKIRDGAIGDIVSCYTDYMTGPVFHMQARNSQMSET